MLDRRSLLLAGLGTPALAWAAPGDPIPLREAAKRMALYGLPLIEMANVRARGFAGGSQPNRLRHSRELTSANNQVVTAPNNDTLYSRSWIDLSAGPVRVTIPATGERYFSFALMDMYTNNFAVLGTRTVGGGGGRFMIVGPNGPNIPGAIRAPTDWVWGLARTLVNGEADLPVAHAIQDQISVEGQATGRTALNVGKRGDSWQTYFGSVQALINESAPPATDTRFFRETARLGIEPGKIFRPEQFTASEAAEISQGLSDALEDAKGWDASGFTLGGWIYPRADLGDFGQDYRYRAQAALAGLAALPREEAIYLRPLGPAGSNELDSRRAWLVRTPPGGFPVDGFWSLTAYEVRPDGQAFLFENAISRYAVGDRTPGLVRERDGSLRILISRDDPGAERRSNWLPSPPSGGSMILSLRLYLPKPELLTGQVRIPPLIAA